MPNTNTSRIFLFEIAEQNHLCGDLELFDSLADLSGAIDPHFIEDEPELFVAFAEDGQRIAWSLDYLGYVRANYSGHSDLKLLMRMLAAEAEHLKDQGYKVPGYDATDLASLIFAVTNFSVRK